MSKGLNDSQKDAVSQNEAKTRILLTITLNNAERDVINIVENDTLQSFEQDGATYLAAMVKRGVVESRMEGGPQKCNIKISNINRAYSQIIANEGDVLTNSRCKIQEVIFYQEKDLALSENSSEMVFENSDNMLFEAYGLIIDNPVSVFEGYVNNIQLTETEFSFDVERILGGYSTVSPNSTYDVNCQWAFKDCRCQYSGEETACDKTFSACQARSNEARFGGYPSIPSELVIRG